MRRIGVAAMVGPYRIFVGLVAAERLVELVLSRRNAAWSRARGGVESGQGHYPWMVALHTGLLAGCCIEAGIRPFRAELAGVMVLVVLAAQALRWWVIRTLGPRWNTRVIIVPNLPAVRSGPFRWLRHPNYLAVVVEGIALPLVHGAWVTATLFTVLNAMVLRERIRVEEAALARLPSGET